MKHPGLIKPDTGQRFRYNGCTFIPVTIMAESKRYDIRIGVKTAYIPEQSDPSSDRYVFAYTITIANHGTASAQLISRHWVITDAENKVQEVRGSGVVGEQPYLKPGQGFRYSSGAVIETPASISAARAPCCQSPSASASCPCELTPKTASSDANAARTVSPASLARPTTSVR